MVFGKYYYSTFAYAMFLCGFGIYILYCVTKYYTWKQLPTSQTQKSLKTILLWNSFFAEKNFAFGIGQKPFEYYGCTFSNCNVTDQMEGKVTSRVEEFDAILFHMVVSTVPLIVPSKRKSHQRYVFFTLESPATNSYDLKPYNDFFNWTMTYRRDSDIWWPYGLIQENGHIGQPHPVMPLWRKPTFGTDAVRFNISGKTKLVAWLVSKCQTLSHREDYVRELSKFIPIDIYGACGNLTCERKDVKACNEHLASTYKFYLSFENSFCDEYVTEKFFRALQYNVVPIVRGGGNYKHIAPPLSYINVDMFNTPKELANFLLHLDKKPTEYRKYFWWTAYYTVSQHYKHAFCKLCQDLNNPQLASKSYDIESWWRNSSLCDRHV